MSKTEREYRKRFELDIRRRGFEIEFSPCLDCEQIITHGSNFSSAKPEVWLQELSPKFLSSVYSQSLRAKMTQNLSYSNSFPVHQRKGGSEKVSTAGTLSVNPGHTHYLLLKGPLQRSQQKQLRAFLSTTEPFHLPHKNSVLILDPCLWQCFYPIFQIRSVFIFSQLSPFYPLITFLKTKVHYIILSPTYLITCKE